MQLSDFTVEELTKEIERKRGEEVANLVADIEAGKKTIQAQEARLRELRGAPTAPAFRFKVKAQEIGRAQVGARKEQFSKIFADNLDGLSLGQLAELAKCGKPAAKYTLSLMVKAGKVRMEGNRGDARYFLVG